MKTVLLLCSLCVLGATALFVMRQQEPTRVRVPEQVARALELPAEAVIDSVRYESEPRMSLDVVVPESDRIDEATAVVDQDSREPLSDELAAVLRERGLEVQVPAMVLYSGFQLNEALRCFEDGMQEIVARYSDAEPVEVGVARMRAQGEDELTIEGEVADWNLELHTYLTVAANLDRIAAELRDAAAAGNEGSAQVQLRAKIRTPASKEGLTYACSFAEGESHFGVQFQKRDWHFALTIPWTFLSAEEREVLTAALARLDRATEAKLARREGREPAVRTERSVATEDR